MDSRYRVDELGWLQFERVCSLVLDADAGLSDLSWLGHADARRVALVDQPVALTAHGIALPGPVTVAILWVAEQDSPERRLIDLAGRVSIMVSELSPWETERVLVLTNLEATPVRAALSQELGRFERVSVLGRSELSEILDRHPAVRAAMPSVLGLRDLTPLIAPAARGRSSLDVDRAQALARVFWPTRAYQRAREVLARHRFVVLTGPPEMGKTAIAQMIALAQMTDGWEAHECNTPEQLWRVFEPGRRQVFIADDAFGSTEYRADAAEQWARSLGRLLGMLGEHHWLIWTSRPAPLKAGLRRVQRERGSERFPAPGAVLVDAGDLDLAEKTLILFRHAKARQASGTARRLVRSAALSIVEHPHFTPERIRRFVSDRIETLPQPLIDDGGRRVRIAVERELASPTEAMRISFRSLEDEHRQLLVALLDAPAGLIDERELAGTMRRHHAGGLSRAPSELVDRLTDHFLSVTSLGIGWVHPSWRDLVIEELREDAAARRAFLGACAIHGAMLALSRAGGSAGERALPLLVDDEDWDLLSGRLGQLQRELEDQDLSRLLVGLRDALTIRSEPAQERELRALAEYLLRIIARRWNEGSRVLPGFAVEGWYALADATAGPVDPRPAVGPTWIELHPGTPDPGRMARSELTRADEWLALAQTLARYDHGALQALGFFGADQKLLGQLIAAIGRTDWGDGRPLAEGVLARIAQLAPRQAGQALSAVRHGKAGGSRWWVPEDIATPPSREPVQPGVIEFTTEDVDRVLSDL